MTQAAPLAAVAGRYAATIIATARQEYPNAPRHVMRDAEDRPRPREIHPAFYGCFDWHSAVEMHWALLRLRRLVPDATDAAAADALFEEHFSEAALAAEARYLIDRPGFERPYGWGWALALADELADWSAAGDERVTRWSANIGALADVIGSGMVDWLARADYPDRVGAHANSAFALARALPFARRRAAGGDDALLAAIGSAARRWFADDVDYPAGWEPGGADFLSAALAEAELMGRTLPRGEFAEWLDRFLPGLRSRRPPALFTPATVSDPTDGQIAHLHGLNLHRAFGFTVLAGLVPSGDARAAVLSAAARAHADAALPHVAGSDYMVEHWLATYAVLFLTEAAART